MDNEYRFDLDNGIKIYLSVSTLNTTSLFIKITGGSKIELIPTDNEVHYYLKATKKG